MDGPLVHRLGDKRKGRPVVLKACALFCSAAIALVLLTM